MKLKDRKVKIFELYCKGYKIQQVVSETNFRFIEVQKYFTEFFYHENMAKYKKNKVYKDDIIPKIKDDHDFVLCSDNPRVLAAFQRMVNPIK